MQHLYSAIDLSSLVDLASLVLRSHCLIQCLSHVRAHKMREGADHKQPIRRQANNIDNDTRRSIFMLSSSSQCSVVLFAMLVPSTSFPLQCSPCNVPQYSPCNVSLAMFLNVLIAMLVPLAVLLYNGRSQWPLSCHVKCFGSSQFEPAARRYLRVTDSS